MSDEPRFHPRRVYYSGSVALPPDRQVHPTAVYFSAAASGYVCLIPETEATLQAVGGGLPPVISRSVLAKLQAHSLEHLEHRMLLTAARPVPADAAFVHRQGRKIVAAYEIRTRDLRRFRAWSVFFFVDIGLSPRQVIHCFMRPCPPGGGLEMDCSVSARPFRAANESLAEQARDIRQAWGMLISYRAVACDAEQPKLEAHDPPADIHAQDRGEHERPTCVQLDDTSFLKCTGIGALAPVEPSLNLGLASPLDFVRTLSVFDLDLCVESPLRGFNRASLSHINALNLLEQFSGELLMPQALTHAEVWRQYRAASESMYAALLGGGGLFRTADLRAAILTGRMIGTTERIWPAAKASCFHDYLHRIWCSSVGEACIEAGISETTVQ